MKFPQITHSLGCLLLSAYVLFPQQAPEPISIQGTIPASPGPGTVYRLVNVSEKEIAGYVLKTQAFDSSGKPTVKVTSLRAFNLEPGSRAKAKGEVWDHLHRGTINAPQTNVTVDYVLFQDGTHWGRNSKASSKGGRPRSRG